MPSRKAGQPETGEPAPSETGEPAPSGTGEPAAFGPAPAWLRVGALGLTVALVVAGTALVGRMGAAGAPGPSVDAGAGQAAAPTLGRPMPDFTATAVDGRPVSLAEFRGRPVWLTFGATWCPPCRAESPELQAAQDAGGDAGVVVLAVYLSEDADAVRAFAARLGLRYRQIADPDRRLGPAYRVVGLPTHFVIDRSGVLREIVNGELTSERITAELARIDP